MHVVILKDYGNPIYWENAVKFLRTPAILLFFPLENILIGFDLVAQAPAFSHGTNLNADILMISGRDTVISQGQKPKCQVEVWFHEA